MVHEAYNIRLTTAHFATFSLPTGQIELIIAEGLGENDGKQMVNIGHIKTGEEDLVHMPRYLPESLLEQAVVDESIQASELRRGNVVTHYKQKGLWVPVDILPTL